jgi:hypothetical protein
MMLQCHTQQPAPRRDRACHHTDNGGKLFRGDDVSSSVLTRHSTSCLLAQHTLPSGALQSSGADAYHVKHSQSPCAGGHTSLTALRHPRHGQSPVGAGCCRAAHAFADHCIARRCRQPQHGRSGAHRCQTRSHTQLAVPTHPQRCVPRSHAACHVLAHGRAHGQTCGHAIGPHLPPPNPPAHALTRAHLLLAPHPLCQRCDAAAARWPRGRPAPERALAATAQSLPLRRACHRGGAAAAASATRHRQTCLAAPDAAPGLTPRAWRWCHAVAEMRRHPSCRGR